MSTMAGQLPNQAEQLTISHTPVWPDARLVDGLMPSEGRLQLKHTFPNQINDHSPTRQLNWYSVCTNSKNWTAVDIDVLCRQLGFEFGHWYAWYNKYNDSRQLMLEAPGCRGHEKTIQECPNWNSKRIGSGVCDYHTDIGIKCSPRLHLQRPTFWAGLRFIQALDRDVYIDKFDNKAKYRRSESALDFVELYYAGENGHGEAVPAVEVIGTPPSIEHTLVRWSASTALNITDPVGGFKIKSTRLLENRGYGVFVNSSRGQVFLENVQIAHNGADGVRFTGRDDFDVSKEEFCNSANLADNQVYPVRLTHEQDRFAQSRLTCCQEFKISNYYSREAQLTAQFKNMISNDFEGEEKDRYRSRDGYVEVFDGWGNVLVSRFAVRNETRPSSVTSTQGRLRICYQPAILRRGEMTVARNCVFIS